MDMVSQPEKDEFKDDEKPSDDELITLLEIQNLIESESYSDAIAKGRSVVQQLFKPTAKRRILTLIIKAHQYLGQLSNAIPVVDEIIDLQSFNAANYF